MGKKTIVKALDELGEAAAAAGMSFPQPELKPQKIKKPKKPAPEKVKKPKPIKSEDLAMIGILCAIQEFHDQIVSGTYPNEQLYQDPEVTDRIVKHIAKIHNKLRKNTKTLPDLVPIKL